MHNFEQKINKDSKKAKQRQLKNKKVKKIVEEQVKEIVKNHPMEEDKEEIVAKKGKKKQESTSFDDFVKLSEEHLFSNCATPKKRKVSRVYEEFLNSTPKKPLKNKKRKKIPEKEEKIDRNSLGAINNLPTKNSKTFVRNSGIWKVEEFDLPPSPAATPDKKKKSPNSDWSKPLANGETEYFVISSKTKKKLKRLSQGEKSQTSPKASKKRSGLVKNPFSANPGTSFGSKTPKSEKKIKFSTLNHSQDFSEHLQQLISSPAVPFDAKRRPSKPLLKPSPMSSPINALHFTKMH